MANRKQQKPLIVQTDQDGRYRVRRKPKTVVPSKLCIRCNEIKPLTDFYANRDWSTQTFHDAWCKECAYKYCTDLDGVKEYCHFNNRHWDDSFWEAAGTKAQYVLANNPDYLNPKVTKRKKEQIRDACIAKQWFSMMNSGTYYQYEDHVGDDGVYNPGTDATVSDIVEGVAGIEKRTYNIKWRGRFTPSEIEELERIYNQLEDDFVLDNENIRDYARKVAKASLDADVAGDKYRMGQISLKEYRDALDAFDSLSKAANFAACRRKPGDSSGLGNLGEIILRLEINGYMNDGNPYQFPEDNIDRVIHDYEHTLVAAGARGELD